MANKARNTPPSPPTGTCPFCDTVLEHPPAHGDHAGMARCPNLDCHTLVHVATQATMSPLPLPMISTATALDRPYAVNPE